MAVREVLRYPHPALKLEARTVDFGADADEIARVAGDLTDTMRSSPGCVGLAAPQLGDLVRMIVVDVTGHRRATAEHGLLLLVNPRISRAEGAEVAREGCLSIPDLTANVRRAVVVEVEATGSDGESVRLRTEGFEARCIQHELDHLDGVLFLDRVDSLVDDVFRRKRSA
ncbi:MAG: peptide deformylase [Solirubrobacteraceae bacterium]|nr:peptide deformylase [Solirubrobacteraceae bacterium]